jgi:hypothetical protein
MSDVIKPNLPNPVILSEAQRSRRTPKMQTLLTLLLLSHKIRATEVPA